MIENIIQKIEHLQKPAVVGISGFGGAGKSTLAKKLGEHFHVAPIGVDEFWKDTTLKEYSAWDCVDFERLEDEVLKPFSQGVQTIEYGNFDWEKNMIEGTKTIEHNGLIIIEGVGLFRTELMKYFSFTVWVDCPLEVAIARGKKRDTEQYGVNHDELWDGIWRKNDEEYIELYQPKHKADFVIEYAGL